MREAGQMRDRMGDLPRVDGRTGPDITARARREPTPDHGDMSGF